MQEKRNQEVEERRGQLEGLPMIRRLIAGIDLGASSTGFVLRPRTGSAVRSPILERQRRS